jgi:hypothetical protein
MLKYFCKECKCNYYSCSEDRKCTTCNKQMRRLEIGNQAIPKKDKIKIDRRWDRLKD